MSDLTVLVQKVKMECLADYDEVDFDAMRQKIGVVEVPEDWDPERVVEYAYNQAGLEPNPRWDHEISRIDGTVRVEGE